MKMRFTVTANLIIACIYGLRGSTCSFPCLMTLWLQPKPDFCIVASLLAILPFQQLAIVKV